MGMANAGALTGIVASNAYFQYTGDRQKATQVLHQWRKRRNIEFHHLYWTRLVFTTLSLPVQMYIMWNGVFRASGLPEDVADWPQKYGYNNIVDPWATPSTSAEPTETSQTKSEPASSEAEAGSGQVEEKRPLQQDFYFSSEDYALLLQNLDIPDRQRSIAERGWKRACLLDEADHLAYQVCAKQYDLLHRKFAPEEEDERKLMLREIALMMVLYNRLRAEADMLDRGVHFSLMALRHRALLDSSSPSSSSSATSPSASTSPHIQLESESEKAQQNEIQKWYPPPYNPLLAAFPHPKLSLEECDKIRNEFIGSIETFESHLQSGVLSAEDKEQARVNLEEGRMLLRAADRVFWRLERLEKEARKQLEVEGKARDTAQTARTENKKIEMEMMGGKETSKGKVEKKSETGEKTGAVSKVETKGTTGTVETEKKIVPAPRTNDAEKKVGPAEKR